MANTFVGEPWRMPYSAEALQNAVANQVPRINETTKHFERWNISKGEWEDTGVKAEGEDGDVSPAQLNAAIAQVNGNIAPVESSSTASRAYAVGELLIFNGVLHEVTAAITTGDALAVGTNLSSGSVTLSEKVTPENAGTTGQVLTKTATGSAWADASGGLLPQVLVTTKAGASVTAMLGSVTVGPVTADENGLATLNLTGYGEWTLTATLGGKTVSDTLAVDDVAQYSVELAFSPLPAGYTELEYIRSDGNCYIDTGVIPKDNTLLVGGFKMYQSTGDAVNLALFGSYTTDYNSPLWSAFYNIFSGNKNITLSCAKWVALQLDFPIYNTYFDAEFYMMHSASVQFKLNDTLITYKDGSNDTMPTTTMYLFGAHAASGKSNSPSVMEWYHNTLYDGLNTSASKLWDLYPAKRDSDNVIGMYDLVANTFRTKVGSGTFTGGPEV